MDDSYIEEPICDVKYGKKGELLDGIHGVREPGKLEYKPEGKNFGSLLLCRFVYLLYHAVFTIFFYLLVILGALKDILQKLSGRTVESVDLVGTRIARALDKDPASWVAANFAALYWRVMGDAPKAIDCIKVAYSNAPRNSRVSYAFSFIGLRVHSYFSIAKVKFSSDARFH